MLNHYYMLVRQGRPQRLQVEQSEGSYKAWPITQSHHDASQLASWLGSTALRPALIGSAQGESLDQLTVDAALDGCDSILIVSGWNSNGNPRWIRLPICQSTSAEEQFGAQAWEDDFR